MTMIQSVKDSLNGEGKMSKTVSALIYSMVGMSMICNLVVSFWHAPVSQILLNTNEFGIMGCLLDMLFIFMFLTSNTLLLALCVDMALTRIARYQRPTPENNAKKLVVGGIPEEWRSLAICYVLTSTLGLTSMLILGMYGRELYKLDLSLGMRAAIYGVSMASVTMMILGGVVLGVSAVTVRMWKSSVKRCSSVCYMSNDKCKRSTSEDIKAVA